MVGVSRSIVRRIAKRTFFSATLNAAIRRTIRGEQSFDRGDRERTCTRKCARDLVHAHHSINNSIIVPDWITLRTRGKKVGTKINENGQRKDACDAMRCDAMRCDATRCDAMRCDTTRCDEARRGTNWHRMTLNARAYTFTKLFQFCTTLSIG